MAAKESVLGERLPRHCRRAHLRASASTSPSLSPEPGAVRVDLAGEKN